MKLYSLFLFVLLSVHSPANGKKDATETIAFVQQVQKKWKSIYSYQAEFEQTVTSKMLGTEDKSSGVISVKKPDKFRWESKADGSLQLIQGSSAMMVQPKAQRGKTVVTTYKDIRTVMDPNFLKLLSGALDLRAGFHVSIQSKTDNSMILNLISKKSAAESYLAEINQKSYLLTALSFQSEDSKTEIRFEIIKTNVELADALFSYEITSEDIHYKK